MPWNEPGDNNQDPWTGKKRPNEGKTSPDQLINSLSKKVNELLNGRKGNNSGNSGSSNNNPMPSMPSLKTLGLIAVGLVGVWLLFGIYTVDARQQALVLRFGAYAETAGPGLHWHIPFPIETVEVIDVDQNRSAQDRSTMLTKDENIVDIAVSVQYKVNDPVAYSFNVRDLDNTMGQSQGTLYQVLRSSIREIVGRNNMDFILKEGREQIAVEAQTLMQDILNGYKAGIRVIKVNLTYAEAPTDVKDAFDDANRAREDANRFQNEADAEAKRRVPEARGQAARLLEEAQAYKQRVIAESEGNAARFTQLATEYHKAPEVTRERLYLDTMEKVMAGSRKVIMDNKQQNILYLPLDPNTTPRAPLPPINPSFTSQNSDSKGLAPAAPTAPTPAAASSAGAPREQRPLVPGAPRESR